VNRKKGELLVISIIVTAIFLILCLSAVSLQYFQISNMLSDLKYNLFYICQNAVLAYDNELNLDIYTMDVQVLKNTVYSLLTKNYMQTRKDIKNIWINELTLLCRAEECINHTLGYYEEPFIHIVVEVEFTPIIKIGDVDKRRVTIHQDVKLSLMKY